MAADDRAEKFYYISYISDEARPICQDYECPICHGILYEPQQIATCGHRYCHKCLQSLMRNNPALCPLDREKIEVDKVFPDVAFKRAIQGLHVKCLNSIQGCQWTGELSNVLKHCDECPLEKIKCSNENCQEMIERRDESKHCKEECVWRMKTCQHCTESYALRLEQSHMEMCKRLPVPCLNKCELILPRCELLDHLQEKCPLSIIDCPFTATGCKLKMTRSDLQSHLEQSTQSHLVVTLKRFQEMDQENKLLKRKWSEIEEKNEQLKRNCEEMKNRLNSCEKRLRNMKDVNNRLYKLEQLPGKLMWRIDYAKLRYRSRVHRSYTYSEPFYSCECGYKLRCLVDYHEGDSNTKESHLSVYIQVLQGRYDALLPWPFSRKIVFTLINQTKENEDIVMELVPKGQDSFQRPKTEESVGRGYKTFASHETIKNGGYLKDKVIFIKVEVEPFDSIEA